MPAKHATCPAGSATPSIEIIAVDGRHGRTAPSQLLDNAGDKTIDTQTVEIDDTRGQDIARQPVRLTGV
jgi:hypothetical protein